MWHVEVLRTAWQTNVSVTMTDPFTIIGGCIAKPWLPVYYTVQYTNRHCRHTPSRYGYAKLAPRHNQQTLPTTDMWVQQFYSIVLNLMIVSRNIPVMSHSQKGQLVTHATWRPADS